MSSVSKGDRLENALYEYLVGQRERGEDVYDFCRPDRCQIRRKAKYYCKEREAYVEFDVVIEIYRNGGDEPTFHYVFECKNYAAGVPEHRVREFSHKLESVFGHSAKGVVVVASRLQSGARKVAENSKMGIAKFDDSGIEVIAERKSWSVERGFVKRQFVDDGTSAKSLKFSACVDGSFLSSLIDLLEAAQEGATGRGIAIKQSAAIPYISTEAIRSEVGQLLEAIGYRSGHVNLSDVCRVSSLSVTTIEQDSRDADGTPVLGRAKFDERRIEILAHGHPFRDRFTLAHEIGHFRLGHGRYLLSETVIEQDLLRVSGSNKDFDYSRMEVQANLFASELLLPELAFRHATSIARAAKEIRDRSFGYIFVDDQPVNYVPYNKLVWYLSQLFLTSEEAVEIRLKSLGLVTDERRRGSRQEAIQLGNFCLPLRGDGAGARSQRRRDNSD
ncbi:restriction endonuclease [Rhizobium sp. PP-CC-2G-626]|nr:restriction endonuclease [Rhizobium sp. PP-CC-2G-626]